MGTTGKTRIGNPRRHLESGVKSKKQFGHSRKAAVERLCTFPGGRKDRMRRNRGTDNAD
jgi:hypothetical protein